VNSWTIRHLSQMIQNRSISVTDLAEQIIARIEQHNCESQALATYSATGFKLLAEAADQAIESDQSVGPLHGVPILVDDLIDVANLRTTYGSEAFCDNIPQLDALAVRRLRAAGALFPGKTATSELGLIQEESPNHFVCRSPWGDRFVSGGGASGSTVGLVNQFGAAAVALDIGGNVLLPAAFSGVFALVPTYGRIPHTPIYAFGTMFASVALVTRNVADCALLMNVVAGHSEVDPLSKRLKQVNYQLALARPVSELRVALAQALWNAPIDEDHLNAMKQVENHLKTANHQVEQARPPIRNSLECWATVLSANLFTNYGRRYAAQTEQFGSLAASWIEQGENVSATDYIEAQKLIYGLRLLLREYFENYDALVFPAAGCLPFEYECVPSNLACDAQDVTWQTYASMSNVAAISGFPTAHLPIGSNCDTRPIGVLVMAKPGDEDLLLALCAQLEKACS